MPSLAVTSLANQAAGIIPPPALGTSPEALSQLGFAVPNDSRGCRITPCHFVKSP
jgi:hypothetical protein